MKPLCKFYTEMKFEKKINREHFLLGVIFHLQYYDL